MTEFSRWLCSSNTVWARPMKSAGPNSASFWLPSRGAPAWDEVFEPDRRRSISFKTSMYRLRKSFSASCKQYTKLKSIPEHLFPRCAREVKIEERASDFFQVGVQPCNHLRALRVPQGGLVDDLGHFNEVYEIITFQLGRVKQRSSPNDVSGPVFSAKRSKGEFFSYVIFPIGRGVSYEGSKPAKMSMVTTIDEPEATARCSKDLPSASPKSWYLVLDISPW